jgi:hypothetical protein
MTKLWLYILDERGHRGLQSGKSLTSALFTFNIPLAEEKTEGSISTNDALMVLLQRTYSNAAMIVHLRLSASGKTSDRGP